MREGLIRAALAEAGRRGHAAMVEKYGEEQVRAWRSKGGLASTAVRRKKARARKSKRGKGKQADTNSA